MPCWRGSPLSGACFGLCPTVPQKTPLPKTTRKTPPEPTCTKCCTGQGKTAPGTHLLAVETRCTSCPKGNRSSSSSRKSRSGRISSKSSNSSSRSSNCRSTSNRNSNSNRNGSALATRTVTVSVASTGTRTATESKRGFGNPIKRHKCRLWELHSSKCLREQNKTLTLSIDEGMECSGAALFPPYAYASHFSEQNPMCCVSSCSKNNG